MHPSKNILKKYTNQYKKRLDVIWIMFVLKYLVARDKQYTTAFDAAATTMLAK